MRGVGSHILGLAVVVGCAAFPGAAAGAERGALPTARVRCATPDVEPGEIVSRAPSDCALDQTVITAPYDPGNGEIVRIPIVVHVITNELGSEGYLSDPTIDQQIQVLNEDFRAIPGSNGADGTDVGIEFVLSGVTRDADDDWFDDLGAYWDTLAWDPDVYCNVYTNRASGALGYVPALPQQGIAGTNPDRIVIFWSVFGTGQWPYDLGRSLTHEMGHYLGLLHTFYGGCGAAGAPQCYESGDLICDTNPEQSYEGACSTTPSCGSPDPIHNYLNYSHDSCMTEFTLEQANRMRCTLLEWRPELWQTLVGVPVLGGPRSHHLAQNRPNPFNPTTEISFDLAREGYVSLVVLDVAGRIIRTLALGARKAGVHRVRWDGTNDHAEPAASGVYFYRLHAEASSQTRRMVLLR